MSRSWKGAVRLPITGVRVLLDLLRGGSRRHRARASVRGVWQQSVARLRARKRRKEKNERPVVLVGLIEHFGDIVAAEPIARYLRKRHADAHIVWAVRPGYRDLVDTHPAIDEALEVRCLTEWMYLRDAQGFDEIIDLHMHGRMCEQCGIMIERPPAERSITIENYYEHGCLLSIFCGVGGLPNPDDSPRVHISPAVRKRIDEIGLPQRFIAVHASSNQAVRDWSAQGWQWLTQQLFDEFGIMVVEVGLTPVVRRDTQGYTDLCGRLSLLETAEVLRRAQAFVGIDSGPAHLANAVGVPGVILLGHFGAFTRYVPYSGRYGDGTLATLLHADGPASGLERTDVLRAVVARAGLTSAAVSGRVAQR